MHLVRASCVECLRVCLARVMCWLGLSPRVLLCLRGVRVAGVQTVTIGVSGGLDSTLALLVAVKVRACSCVVSHWCGCNGSFSRSRAQAFDRLGLPRTGIHGISMPGVSHMSVCRSVVRSPPPSAHRVSPDPRVSTPGCAQFGTTPRTQTNAEKLSRLLGVHFQTIPITDAVRQVRTCVHACVHVCICVCAPAHEAWRNAVGGLPTVRCRCVRGSTSRTSGMPSRCTT